MLKDLGLLLFVGVTIYGLATGKATTRGLGVVRRSEHPIYYWILQTIWILVAILFLCLVVYDIFLR